MALPPGTLLGSFEILSPIGAGGMGEVYRARDTKLGRDVAFKVLPEAFSEDADRLVRFQREAHILASLNHPHIAQIYGVVEADRTRGIVMELVEGETLQRRLQQGAIPVNEAFRIAKQIAEALEAAHDRGIVHRDLKPGNIMLDADGNVKVLDFGLAKAMDPTGSDSGLSHSPTLISAAHTQSNTLIGTAAYMSPEQVRGHATSERSDVWAFGCVLYEMVTGQQAFTGETITDIIGGIVRIDPDWSAVPASTPPRLRTLLKRCLEKDRKRRYHAIGDVRWDLEAALTTSTSPARNSRERLAWSLTAVLLVASLTLFIAARYFSPAPAEPIASRFLIEFPPNTVLGSALASPFPIISPDGRYVAFTGVTTPAGRLWLRPIGSLAAQPMSGTDTIAASNNHPFWSRDNRFIAYFSDGKLRKVAIAGGPPQILCDAVGDSLTGSWNADDVILFENQGSIHRVGAGGGVSTPLRTPDKSKNEMAYKFPAFLPDGRHFLYVAASSEAGRTGIRVGSLDSGASADDKFLFAGNSRVLYSNPGYLLFVRDGTLMAQPFDARKLVLTGDVFPVAEQVAFAPNNGTAAFSVSDNETLVYRTNSAGTTTELTWLDRSGKKIGIVPASGNFQRPYLSSDQNRLAVQRIDTADIWWIDLLRGTNSRFTFEGGDETYPVFSSDGKQIAFTSVRDGKTGLYVKAASGVGAEELLLTVQGGDPAASDWSPDGKNLLYSFTTAETGWETWVLPLTDRKPYPLLNQKYSEYRVRFSPDGRWITYTSNETGRNEIYIQSFPPSGGKWQVSVDGAGYAYWRRDGKEIIFDSLDGKMMAADVKLGANLEIGVPRELFPMPGPAVGTRFAITSDAQRFLLPLAPQSLDRPTLTTVLNWTADIKK